jgi:hypothetical protein
MPGRARAGRAVSDRAPDDGRSNDPAAIQKFLPVPLTYEIVDEGSAVMVATIILAAGAGSAVIGIGQYAFLQYDNLD